MYQQVRTVYSTTKSNHTCLFTLYSIACNQILISKHQASGGVVASVGWGIGSIWHTTRHGGHSTVHRMSLCQVVRRSTRRYHLPCTHTHTHMSDIPASGQLREVLPVSYTVHNKTDLIQEFEVKMGANDVFMYSGEQTGELQPLILHSKGNSTFSSLAKILTQERVYT